MLLEKKDSLRVITVKKLQKLLQKKVTYWVGQLFLIQASGVTLQDSTLQLYRIAVTDSHTTLHCLKVELFQVTTPMDESLIALLAVFENIFTEPKSLPPLRSYDHRIPLLLNSTLVNIKPYEHSYDQKNEVEKLVKEMHESRIIQLSHSPFALPVPLVKKMDGTQRFYINYKQLNANTIKDKFSFDYIDDLLDEFQGAKLFSKLDLR